MKSKFCRNKLLSVGMVVFLMLLISACSSSTETASISNFQEASVVIGQTDFTVRSPNQGGSAGANTINTPYGNPVVINGILYLPDYANNRVLGFNTVPTSNNASADFVLGQGDFIHNTRNDDDQDGVDGSPTARTLRAPESVSASDGKLLVNDYGNHRILIWNSAPTTSYQSADFVVGQTDFSSNGDSCTKAGLSYPESIRTSGGKLIVADSGHNRVLIWNTIPTSNGTPADVVIGQNSFTTCAYNDSTQDGSADSPTAQTLSHPTDVWSDGTRLIVADKSNNRVLIWNTIPTSNFVAADVVLGQADFIHNARNDDDQDGSLDLAPTARTLYSPYYLDSNGIQLFVGDSLNNRVLIWNTIPTSNFVSADVVLGQADFTHNAGNDDDQNGAGDGAPTARTLYYPTGLYVSGTKLFVGDNNNQRYLIFE